jgi:hypothetical protein
MLGRMLFGDLDRDMGGERGRGGAVKCLMKRNLVSDAVVGSFLREAIRN